MRLTFLGATHEVTGSCYYLEAAGKKFLVDCGMEQGPNIYENKPIPVPASQLDFVLITHAHIDHTGNLPLLYAHGFRGPIYMTPATVALSDIMLRDSTHSACRGRVAEPQEPPGGKRRLRYAIYDGGRPRRDPPTGRHSVSSACDTIGRHPDPFPRCRSSARLRIH